MATEAHPAFTHNRCPKGCGLTLAILMDNECLTCTCEWAQNIYADEYGEPDEDLFQRCGDCDSHDACEDFGCAIDHGVPVNEFPQS